MVVVISQDKKKCLEKKRGRKLEVCPAGGRNLQSRQEDRENGIADDKHHGKYHFPHQVFGY